jgi:hypothetical protein
LAPSQSISATAAAPAVPLARSYLLLRGPLESGFVGYLPEFALLHTWDCIAGLFARTESVDVKAARAGASHFIAGQHLMTTVRQHLVKILLVILQVHIEFVYVVEQIILLLCSGFRWSNLRLHQTGHGMLLFSWRKLASN